MINHYENLTQLKANIYNNLPEEMRPNLVNMEGELCELRENEIAYKNEINNLEIQMKDSVIDREN